MTDIHAPDAVPAADAAPLEGFSGAHRGILCAMRAFAALPEFAAAAERSRQVAITTLQLFEGTVLPHHADEESELFPAVIRSATPGPERTHVEAMVDRLVAEHRSLESLWKMLRPAVKRAAAGITAQLDAEAVAALSYAYHRHAAFEETEFLPLAGEILARNGNHMAALGLAIHLRHAPAPVAYI
ncbi:hemerythrin domain-containing protein [Ramlibacter sp. WS9]|uniref:hemerythrin domain-containing protein n=1 Tax=Ramlibacter sp. WS9 TaxID=1882741 RepID=UPI001144E278|nr:hemerythrin domain-containing protein [Ramlibacter sp. WS9]ROZ75451.1 hemerythrin domain-containing protein [Ramlibacter sp. WS9]